MMNEKENIVSTIFTLYEAEKAGNWQICGLLSILQSGYTNIFCLVEEAIFSLL